MAKKVITTGFILLIIVAVIPAVLKYTPPSTSEQPIAAFASVINNGGSYVKYNGNVYYREYNAHSVDSSGLFANYDYVSGAVKDMVCLAPDGGKQVLFKDKGSGGIYIYNDQFYLEEINSAPNTNDSVNGSVYTSTIYTVALNGENRHDLAGGNIKAIDEKAGLLICAKENDFWSSNIFTINLSNYSVKTLATDCTFTTEHDGVVYYEENVDDDNSRKGQICLEAVTTDGSQRKKIVTTGTDLYPDGGGGPSKIQCIQFVGEDIYFSYGSYAGSGNFFQGGNICRVKKDGSGFEKLINGSVTEMSHSGNITDPNFIILSKNQGAYLYYSDYASDTDSCLDLQTMQSSKTSEAPTNLIRANSCLSVTSDYTGFKYASHAISPIRYPFTDGDNISVYLNDSDHKTILLTTIDYQWQQPNTADDSETLRNIKDMEIVDGYFYFTIEDSVRDPNIDVGWRYGYSRQTTQVFRKPIGAGAVESLYSF